MIWIMLSSVGSLSLFWGTAWNFIGGCLLSIFMVWVLFCILYKINGSLLGGQEWGIAALLVIFLGPALGILLLVGLPCFGIGVGISALAIKMVPKDMSWEEFLYGGGWLRLPKFKVSLIRVKEKETK